MKVHDDELEERILAENYKIWRKNVPYLYDVMIAHALEWPSLTVQWLPDKMMSNGKGHSERRLILGTHTADGEANHLMIAKVTIPEEEDPEKRKYNEETEEAGGYGHGKSKIEVVQRINHDGEVNRARYMPQNPCVIATKSPSGKVLIFDYTKHPSVPNSDGVCRPDMTLLGHSKQGFGLCWNPSIQGLLLSGSDDGRACIWDVEAAYTDRNGVQPFLGLTAHPPAVQDVCWLLTSPHVFASVGDDARLCLWDSQVPGDRPAQAADRAHVREVHSVATSPHTPHLLLTASADQTVALWDTRNLSHKLHTFEGHTGPVLQVQWSAKHPTVFASCSQDRRVCVWDLGRIGEQQPRDDAADGPPELMFVHAGHSGEVTEAAWDPGDSWLLASVSADNTLHIWQMDESNYSTDEVVAID